jgi:hemerythrin
MIAKQNYIDTLAGDKIPDIVVWGPKYNTGITLIDQQHKELASLTNELYRACLSGHETAGAVFRETMGRMVEYVRFHFEAEQKLLQAIEFPNRVEHKKKHEALIRSILDAAKDFGEGKKFIPNQFVRTLKDWLFSHIGIEDKIYAAYADEQKKKGLLTDGQIDSMLHPCS